jgi:mono/diheme cytochrome c family protein
MPAQRTTGQRTASGALLALSGIAMAAALFSPARLAGQAPTKAQPQVTFAKDIAPILQRSCQTCHRPNALAPMSLLTYEEARYAASIAAHRDPQLQGTMPPGIERISASSTTRTTSR